MVLRFIEIINYIRAGDVDYVLNMKTTSQMSLSSLAKQNP